MTLASFCGPPNAAKQALRPVYHRGVSTASKTVPCTAWSGQCYVTHVDTFIAHLESTREKWRAILAHRLAAIDVGGVSAAEREYMHHHPLYQLTQLGKLSPISLIVCRPMMEPIPFVEEDVGLDCGEVYPKASLSRRAKHIIETNTGRYHIKLSGDSLLQSRVELRISASTWKCLCGAVTPDRQRLHLVVFIKTRDRGTLVKLHHLVDGVDGLECHPCNRTFTEGTGNPFGISTGSSLAASFHTLHTPTHWGANLVRRMQRENIKNPPLVDLFQFPYVAEIAALSAPLPDFDKQTNGAVIQTIALSVMLDLAMHRFIAYYSGQVDKPNMFACDPATNIWSEVSTDASSIAESLRMEVAHIVGWAVECGIRCASDQALLEVYKMVVELGQRIRLPIKQLLHTTVDKFIASKKRKIEEVCL